METVKKLQVGKLDFSRIPPVQLKILARYTAGSKAQTLERLLPERKIATLLAFMRVLEATSQDDVLDVLELLTQNLLARAEQGGQQERLRTIPELDQAALQLADACEVLIDAQLEEILVRASVYEQVEPGKLRLAINRIRELARPAGQDNYYELLQARYKTVRHFWPLLLKTIEFKGVEAAGPVLLALTFLSSLEGKSKPSPKMEDAPTEIVNRAWHSLVYQRHHQPHDRHYYTFCVLEQLQEALKRLEIFIVPSERWGNPGAKLISDELWPELKPQICRTLSRQAEAKTELAALKRQLDTAYLRTAANLPNNADLRIEKNHSKDQDQKEGEDRLVLTPLEKQVESESLVTLRESVAAMLPPIELAEVILEIQARTNFAAEFTHLSESGSRSEKLPLSICAVLLAEACNIGIEPIIQREIPALRRDRLLWVQQNYIRTDTLSRANARLVEAQSLLSLAQSWGGEAVASADGLRFVVPVRHRPFMGNASRQQPIRRAVRVKTVQRLPRPMEEQQVRQLLYCLKKGERANSTKL